MGSAGIGPELSTAALTVDWRTGCGACGPATDPSRRLPMTSRPELWASGQAYERYETRWFAAGDSNLHDTAVTVYRAPT